MQREQKWVVVQASQHGGGVLYATDIVDEAVDLASRVRRRSACDDRCCPCAVVIESSSYDRLPVAGTTYPGAAARALEIGGGYPPSVVRRIAALRAAVAAGDVVEL